MANERSDTLVLFGATGDLAHKKIFPALYAMVAKRHADRAGDRRRAGRLGRGEQLQARARDGIVHALGSIDEQVFAKLAALLRYVERRLPQPGDLRQAKDALGLRAAPLYYLAVPPSMFEPVVQGLEQSGGAAGARLMVEKPFGRDLQSARWLNRVLHIVFEEKSIFRIDHYLGKEAIQNLLYFRFANSFLEPIWKDNLINDANGSGKETSMQIGMMGLGRMGANMVRRLMRAGHQCVVYDINPRVAGSRQGRRHGAASLEEFVGKLKSRAPPG